MTTFIKHYHDPETARAALAHYHWLTNLAAEVELPALCGHSDRTLEFVHIAGRVADLGDLPAVAGALGRLHRAARQAGLAQAQANSRYCTCDGAILAPFAAPRRRRLHELRARTSDSPLSHNAIDSWLDAAALLPVALYKDANPRNFLITDRGPVLVDFDSLTLAPVGYDLAKLLVTLAMTIGVLPATSVDEAVAAYTGELDQPCPRTEIAVWAEMHHLLTRPYLGRHGYQHPWPAVRPWPAPDAAAVATPGSRECL